MLSRRDFISCQFRREEDVKEVNSPEDLSVIASDFSEEMLCREMMRIGKDPSNMNREQMLHTVFVEMRR